MDDVDKKLMGEGIFILAGRIDEESTTSAIKFILAANLDKTHKLKYLTIIIHSRGGIMTAAFALIDIMRGSRIPIRTIGLGQIASSGLLIFISGTAGQRILTPNTSILSHQYTWGQHGKEHELIATQKEFNFASKRLLGHYKKCTGLTEKVIREKLLPPEDVWLSATEAKKYNLCDKIKDMK